MIGPPALPPNWLNSNLAVGTHTLTASYSGDVNFAGSNGTLSGGQSVNKANTSTSVTSSLNTSTFGQTVTFTATVTVNFPGTTAAGSPAGTVTFCTPTTREVPVTP